ncbi:MAG TPA: hypothetical protein VM012_08795 [Flavitalea sp.]|nr:hypothetical protein [Flavitalea sp.]
MQLHEEACVLSRYLGRKNPDAQSTRLYVDAVEKIAIPLSGDQKRIWEKCLSHSWLLPSIDAALAWNEPYNPIRNRIFIMLSILETRPDFTHLFLPVRRSPFYLFSITGRLIAAFMKLIIGKIALWIL